ncbi:MAG: hypothetical protein RL508_737 [Actinomycetota bacterium]|jgi:antitoxin StbD
MEKFKVELAASITEFKKNPNEIVKKANGKAIAVLTNNKPSFFVLPPKLYEQLEELIWELEIAPVLIERMGPGQINIEIEDPKDLLGDLSHYLPPESDEGVEETRPKRKTSARKEARKKTSKS